MVREHTTASRLTTLASKRGFVNTIHQRGRNDNKNNAKGDNGSPEELGNKYT